MGRDILARGEAARALDMLAYIHIQLIRMVRVLEGSYGRHWATPSRALEQDMSPEAYARYKQCSASLDAGALRRAYAEAEETSLHGSDRFAGGHWNSIGHRRAGEVLAERLCTAYADS